MTTAAHGVHRGARLWVWKQGKPPRTGFAVTVNDAGPYVRGRVLDLSTGAFRRLAGSLRPGVVRVSYKLLRDGRGQWTGRTR